MPQVHSYYLNLGSNIQPERNIPEAVRLLRTYGRVIGVSHVWESGAVGSDGPNFLNASVAYETEHDQTELKREIVAAIEKSLGRSRTNDKYAPRTIDIDVLMQDQRTTNIEIWKHAFVVLPMAELLPDLAHPTTGRRLADEALQAAASVWIRRRPEITIQGTD